MQAGFRFRQALQKEKPLQIVGVPNALVALMAEEQGFLALYLSGAGVANISYGLPDIGITTLDNVLEDLSRIVAVTNLPILVDIDTGWGSAFMIERTIKALIQAGAAGVHIEDQVFHKRCGHRPGKALVAKEEMVDRLKAALDARSDPQFVIMARTDAKGEEALERAMAYRDAGADMLFPEAVTTLDEARLFKTTLDIPILVNLTEFGKTPLFTREELLSANIDMALYPLSASRAMQKAAQHVLREIREKGTQKGVIPSMQTREELYKILNYQSYEEALNRLYSEKNHVETERHPS